MPPVEPLLSIAIPSYNRADSLARLVEQLAGLIEQRTAQGLSQPGEIEVVVVLDGGTDDSAERLHGLATNFPGPLKWKSQPNRGLSATRNRLVSESSGKRVWHLDDDMMPDAEALETHLNSEGRTESVVRVGPSYVAGESTLATYYRQRWSHYNDGDRIDNARHVSFANSSAPREVFLTHRFDETFTSYGIEDHELAIRMLGSGVEFRLAAEAAITHHNTKSAIEILRDVRSSGYNSVLLARRHPEHAAESMNFGAGRIDPVLKILAQRGQSRILWALAVAIRTAGRYLPDDQSRRFTVVSERVARYSGAAELRPEQQFRGAPGGTATSPGS